MAAESSAPMLTGLGGGRERFDTCNACALVLLAPAVVVMSRGILVPN